MAAAGEVEREGAGGKGREHFAVGSEYLNRRCRTRHYFPGPLPGSAGLRSHCNF